MAAEIRRFSNGTLIAIDRDKPTNENWNGISVFGYWGSIEKAGSIYTDLDYETWDNRVSLNYNWSK